MLPSATGVAPAIAVTLQPNGSRIRKNSGLAQWDVELPEFLRIRLPLDAAASRLKCYQLRIAIELMARLLQAEASDISAGIDRSVYGPFRRRRCYATELKKLKSDAGRVRMDVLDKSHNATWTDANRRIPDSNLDHVLASRSMRITRWQFSDNVEGEVEVAGWNAFANGSAGWRSFVSKVSDHCSLYFEVE